MKGFAGDLVILMVFVGFFVFMIVIGFQLANDFKDKGIFNISGTDFYPNIDRAFTALDYGVLMIVLAMGLGMIVSAFYINTHPVFFVIFLIMFIFIVAGAGPFSNFMMDMFGSDQLVNAANRFPVGLRISGDLPIYITVFGIVTGVILFAKIGGKL